MSSHQIGFVRFPFPPTPTTRKICAAAVSHKQSTDQATRRKLSRLLRLRSLQMKYTLKLFELERTIHKCHEAAQKQALYRQKAKFNARQAKIRARIERLGPCERP